MSDARGEYEEVFELVLEENNVVEEVATQPQVKKEEVDLEEVNFKNALRNSSEKVYETFFTFKKDFDVGTAPEVAKAKKQDWLRWSSDSMKMKHSSVNTVCDGQVDLEKDLNSYTPEFRKSR